MEEGSHDIIVWESSDLMFRAAKEDEFDLGQTPKRHGSVLNITAKEAARLLETYRAD